MADVSRLSRLIDGIVRNVDLSQNSLVVGSVKVGAGQTELTQVILDKLVLMQGVARADGKYDANDIVVGATPTNYSAATQDVEAHLAGLDSAIATAGDTVFSDAEFRVQDNLDATKQVAVEAGGITTSTTRTITMPDTDVDLGQIATNTSDISNKIDSSEKGAVNGVATLNASGKLTNTQVPALAITETFSVADIAARDALVIGTADGEVQEGDVAIVTDASADVDVDSGGASYIYDGTDWKRLVTPTDHVQSVNGQTGTVVLDTDDISEAASNLYHTDARAKSAAVVDSLAGSETDQAPSVSSVNTALDSKQDASLNLDEADTFFGATDLSGAEAEQLSDGSNADSLHSHAKIVKNMVAGEAFDAETSYMVRIALDGETAGRVYKADHDASTSDTFYAIGFIQGSGAASKVAGDSVDVILMGEIALGTSDTAFGATEIGQAVHLTSAGAFDVVSQITYTADQASYRGGMCLDTSKVLVGNMQLLGIN